MTKIWSDEDFINFVRLNTEDELVLRARQVRQTLRALAMTDGTVMWLKRQRERVTVEDGMN